MNLFTYFKNELKDKEKIKLTKNFFINENWNDIYLNYKEYKKRIPFLKDDEKMLKEIIELAIELKKEYKIQENNLNYLKKELEKIE